MICENCGKEFFEDWRKDRKARKTPCRFCCRKCANTRYHSEETKIKLSDSARTSEKAIKSRIKWLADNEKRYALSRIFRTCPVCGKEFKVIKNKRENYCSSDCWNKVSGGIREGSGRSKSGYYKGIFCNSTYELCWVIYNLDHNISFKRSKLQIPYEYEGCLHIYCPDFELENGTIIETKGYHTDIVDIKTEAAKKQGYNIEILYENDLKYAFDYVKDAYNVFDFTKLYDVSKDRFTYICDICGKEFTRAKEIKTGPKLCSRSCSCKNARIIKMES